MRRTAIVACAAALPLLACGPGSREAGLGASGEAVSAGERSDPPVAAVAIAAGREPSPPEAAAAVASGGAVQGRVVAAARPAGGEGVAPECLPLAVSAPGPGGAGRSGPAGALAPVEGALVVWRGVAPDGAARLAPPGGQQTGVEIVAPLRRCRLDPFLVLAPSASVVRIVQEDDALHSLVVGPGSGAPVEAGLPFPGMELRVAVGTDFGERPVFCRSHRRVEGWIVRAPGGPWAQSDAAGEFSLPWPEGAGALPPDGAIEAWHPEHGRAVVVAADLEDPTAGRGPRGPLGLVLRAEGETGRGRGSGRDPGAGAPPSPR